MSISVVLATYNEEQNLSECLESVKDLADEIIVVDGKSVDKTVEIAQKYNAKIKILDNPTNFHINKQKAIDMATSDWILQLDADERVSPQLASEIIQVIGQKSQVTSNESINGYWIPRKNYFLGRFLKKGGQYPDYTLRLYKKGKGKLPQKSVHEQAVVEGKVLYLKHPLIHMADKDLSRYFMRFNRYTDLIAQELKHNKTRHNPFIALKHLFLLPIWWFLLTYIRHKGFLDSWQGFLFSFFSASRFPVSYLKLISSKNK